MDEMQVDPENGENDTELSHNRILVFLTTCNKKKKHFIKDLGRIRTASKQTVTYWKHKSQLFFKLPTSGLPTISKGCISVWHKQLDITKSIV